jgi:hypothetical protein
MAIQTKDDAQSKADRRVDRSFFKKTKQKPLMEMKFSEVISNKKTNEWSAFLFENNASKADGLKNNEVEVKLIEQITGFKFK